LTNVRATGTGEDGSGRRPDHAAGRYAAPRRARTAPEAMTSKPAAEELGIDLSCLTWRQSAGTGSGADLGAPGVAGSDPDLSPGAIEVAVAERHGDQTWVLVRVARDPAGRVLVYDQHEWECFLDGVRNGEFDLPG
jgi:hypothetical protein